MSQRLKTRLRADLIRERNALIERLYGEYLTHRAIGREVGLTGESVRLILRAAGVETRGWNRPPKPGRQVRRTTPEARFWSKVDRSGGPEACWPWTAKQKSKNGRFGVMIFAGKTKYAHQLAWFFEYGKFSEQWILHRCPLLLCCNPGHLMEGTRSESIILRGLKGRTARGERSGVAKLTAAAVLEIREAARRPGYSRAVTARRYGVHPVTITDVVKGRTWKHLPVTSDKTDQPG